MNAIKKRNGPLLLRPIYLFIFAVSLVYIYLLHRDAVILKPNGSGRTLLFIISITIAIPEILIWVFALATSLKLKVYARSIKASKDGAAMVYLADALILMSVYIVLVCISSSITTLFKNTDNLNTIVSVTNYIPLAVAFASSTLLVFAATRFNRLVSLKLPKRLIYLSAGLFVLLVGLFIWHFTLTHPKQINNDSIPRFVSGVTTLLYIYILPQVILWGMGLFACLEIANYSLKVRGSIYKKLLNNLSKGVLIVFICIFMAQLLILSNFNLNKFNIFLVLIYFLLMFGAYGFTLIYKGTSSLSKLEKI